MNVQSIDQLLSNHAFFKGMSQEHLALIAGCGRNAQFPPGTFLFREDEPADHFYIIRSGSVAIEVHSPNRGTLTIETIGENEVLGWSWLVPPHISQFAARAIDPVRATSMDAKCLRGKFDTDHELGFQLMRRFAVLFGRRLQATRLQLLDLYRDHA